MVKTAIQEPFSLTKGETGVTSQDGLTASSEFGMIYSYQVPIGQGLIILPGHTFSLYLEGADNSEMPATTRVKVVVKDSAKQEEKAILGPTMYQTLKEFQDRDKIARFNTPGAVKVYERQYLEVWTAGADAAGTGGVDQTGMSSDTYFNAEISRVRQPLQ